MFKLYLFVFQMEELGLDAEAMQRYIATMPHVSADLSGFRAASTSPSASTRSPKPDLLQQQPPQTESGDITGVSIRLDKSSSNVGSPALSDSQAGVKSHQFIESSRSTVISASAASVKEEQENGSVFSGASTHRVPLPGCDGAAVAASQGGDFVVIVKQEADDIRTSSGEDNISCVVDDENEVLVLSVGKREFVSIAEGSVLENGSTQGCEVDKGGKTVGANVDFVKKHKSESSRPSLNDVISNLSQGAAVLSELSVPSPLSPSVSSSVLWAKLSRPILVEGSSQSVDTKSSGEKSKTNSLPVSRSSWFSMPQGVMSNGTSTVPTTNSQSISCQAATSYVDQQLAVSSSSNTHQIQASTSGTGTVHHPPTRRRSRKPVGGMRDRSSSPCTSRSSAGSKALITTSTSSASRPSPGAPPNASVFQLPYSPVLPAVYDYNLPDRGLSSAAASIMAANTPFPQPHLTAPQPFMMGYFPLPPIWGGTGTVAIAAATAAAATNVNLPIPLDLSSPNKDRLKPDPVDKPAADKAVAGKDLSVKPAANIQPGALLQGLQASSHAKDAIRRNHRSGQIKTNKINARNGISSEKNSALAIKVHEKQSDSIKKDIEKTCKETYPDVLSKSPEVVVSKPRYEKNLLLFGDQEIEIMSVGKFRWVVRNEADLLRIAQTNLKKSSPVCDSATVVLEANSSTENSTCGESRANNSSRDRTDCPVSSSVRRDDGELEEGRRSPRKMAKSKMSLCDQPTSPTPSKCPKLDNGGRLSQKNDIIAAGYPASEGKPHDSGSATSLPNFLIDSALSDSQTVNRSSSSASSVLLSSLSENLPAVVKGSSTLPQCTILKHKHEEQISDLMDKSRILLSASAACTSSESCFSNQSVAVVESTVKSKYAVDTQCDNSANDIKVDKTVSVLTGEDEALSKEYSLLSSMLKSAH